MAHCNSITKVEATGGIDILLVNIDNVDAYWFYDYALALDFVDKDVIVTYRDDFYKGARITAINTIAKPFVINVLDKHVALKLYSEAEDNSSNLSFNEIEVGSSRDGCIFFCCSQTTQQSGISNWLEFLVRDKLFRVAKLRIFNPTQTSSMLAGHYCMATLRRTKWGFDSDLIAPTTIECPPNPEITLAEEYINQFFANDIHAQDFMNNNMFIKHMKEYVDYEPGYALCRLAMELCLCEQMQNMTKDIDTEVLSHAILTSYGHCATPNMPMSKELSSVILATRSKWKNLQLLLSILDPGNLNKEPNERDIYKRIKEMVDSIVVSKKTYRKRELNNERI